MKKLFFTHSITLFRVVLILLALSYSATAEAQSLKFSASDMVRMGPNSTKWRYNEVQCSGSVTSITISMINNKVDALTSSVRPSNSYSSLGINPRTNTYLFSSPLSPENVVSFVKGIVFDQTTDVKDAAQYIHLYVDANPTRLPEGANITVWREHPDGSVHYYVWVPVGDQNSTDPKLSPTFKQAYDGAKSYYFQGRRGYLPTITSLPEDTLLTNISAQGGWSAGARTKDLVNDRITLAQEPSLDNVNGKNFKWLCGPESERVYFRGPAHGSSGWGNHDAAYNNWERIGDGGGGDTNEPNNGAGGTENAMQINFRPGRRGWNDLPTNPRSTVVRIYGYFIEFGGSGDRYTVNGAIYNANSNYKTPTAPTTNAQWERYNPGSTAVSEATVKQRTMRSYAMALE